MNSRLKYLLASSAFVSIVAPLAAQAQIDTIVVTANKREQDINDIGLSVSAISGEKLAERKISSLSEISGLVPGLTFAQGQFGPPVITLRGVGFNETSLGVYPSTSLYLDEVPLPFPAMAVHTAFDLERLEVLKGPQGVLFGQNATGGAVNFIAAKPTEEFSAGGDVSYGRFNRVEANGYLSGPLTDSIGFRAAAQIARADEWQKSVTRVDEIGAEEYATGRILVTYDNDGPLRLTFNANGWVDRSDPTAYQQVAITPKRPDQAPGNALLQLGEPFGIENARSADWTAEYPPEADKEFWQTSLRGDLDIGDSTIFTAIVAHSDYSEEFVADTDGSQLITSDVINQIGEIQSTFAEVRLDSTAIPNLRWLIGANYENSDTDQTQLSQFSDNTTFRPQANFINRNSAQIKQAVEAFAVFGNIEFDLNESLKLKGGVRYTDTTIDANSCNFDPGNAPGIPTAMLLPVPAVPNANVATLWNYLGSLSGRAFTPIGIGDCFSLDDEPGLGIPAEYVDTLAEDNISWRAGIDFRASDNVLLYANASKGFKTGSFPVISAATHNQLRPVTQESVLAYEAGFKATLADNRLQWNGAGFYYDYQDKQVRGKRLTAIFGPLDALVNVPESSVWGLETDFAAAVTDEVTFSGSLTFIKSEVETFVGFDVFGNADVDFAGVDLPNAPELSYTLGIDYRRPVRTGTLVAGIDLQGQTDSDAVFGAQSYTIADVLDPSFASSAVDNYFVIDGYATLDARLGYEAADGQWRVFVWGKNITNEYYYNNVIAASEGGVRSAEKPVTYGITFGASF
ncbi:TonB-dependent receptor [Hyphococcus sp.]|uniref:TonB-dependent receptor n=1 Tax=Hyphococcus sp. TaxID=2038636 RepID=UPI0035C75CC4